MCKTLKLIYALESSIVGSKLGSRNGELETRISRTRLNASLLKYCATSLF